MPNHQFRQRLDALFIDMERLAADPDCASPRVRRELDALLARVHEVEEQIAEREKCSSPEQTMPTAPPVEPFVRSPAPPILYEKEQIGYVFSEDVLHPLQVATPPDTNSDKTIVVPLTSSGQMIGKMQIEPPAERSLTPEETNLLEAIALQASQQIENLRLLAATERARTEAEAATRRFMHEGWASYLDAIHNSERVGYAYDQTAVTSYVDPSIADEGFHESVKVLDEQVGTLSVKPDPTRPLTDQDKKIVSLIAKQVAQQVENIRLLADASRARAEAEEATRLLTRQNWSAYAEQQEGVIGFVYDSNNVRSLETETLPNNIAFEQPLIVRGEPIGQLAVAGLQNVSQEAKNLAAAIATQASIHLETLRLTQELQLRAVELQKLDRLKTDFLANMSHELRTPLNSILGFTDVMLEELDGPLTENMNNDLRLIQKNGQHLLHLINDVLDMAKIEAGRMNLNPEKFKIYDVLDEVNSITSTLASEKNLTLFIDNDTDQEVEIYADRTRVRQVMINLVNNAIKFTETGKIVIKAIKQDDVKALITVKDTGIGIPQDKLDAIFLEFTQVDTSSTRKSGGTGLGLPISRRLVEMHGGRLWVESTGILGEGSTFYVELPLEAHIIEIVEKQGPVNVAA